MSEGKVGQTVFVESRVFFNPRLSRERTEAKISLGWKRVTRNSQDEDSLAYEIDEGPDSVARARGVY